MRFLVKTAPKFSCLGERARAQYYTSDAGTHQPSISQAGALKDRTAINQSPLTRKSTEGVQNYTNLLRSSLEQPSKSTSNSKSTPSPTNEYSSGKLSASSNLRRSMLDSAGGFRSSADTSTPASKTSDSSTYRKGLLAEYRNSAGAESLTGPSRLLQDKSYAGGVSTSGAPPSGGYIGSPSASGGYSSGTPAAGGYAGSPSASRGYSGSPSAAGGYPSGLSASGGYADGSSASRGYADHLSAAGGYAGGSHTSSGYVSGATSYATGSASHSGSSAPLVKQSHNQTPAATETSNFTTSVATKDNKYKHSALGSSDKARTSDSTSPNAAAKSSRNSQQGQLSVFNYEGADRSNSRNHLHMLMNHNMMNARQQEEDSNKKKSNTKKARRKITVNLQGTRYDVGKYSTPFVVRQIQV